MKKLLIKDVFEQIIYGYSFFKDITIILDATIKHYIIGKFYQILIEILIYNHWNMLAS